MLINFNQFDEILQVHCSNLRQIFFNFLKPKENCNTVIKNNQE